MNEQTLTISQVFGRNPQISAFSLLPQFRLSYEYPENYTPVSIENPADAITLFRATRSKDNPCGYLMANYFYALLLRNDTVLGIQLVDITLEDIKKLCILQVVRMAYVSNATHLILFSTHNQKEVDDYSLATDQVIRDMPDTFEAFELTLIDYIRVSPDRDFSAYAQGYDEFCTSRRVSREEDYSLRRKYRFN